jgi:two-component system, NtrC family, nitrogen regulation sensor histidine kinase GlnL
MTKARAAAKRAWGAGIDAAAVLAALPDPVLVVDAAGALIYANGAAEQFFDTSASTLLGAPLIQLLPPDSPVFPLIDSVRASGHSVSEYGVTLETPRLGAHVMTVQAAPIAENRAEVVVTLQERSIAHKIDRQLTHRNAARSVTAMAAMLAHEVKNPLSGIRGAAQLLESSVNDEDRALTRLICEETDRIVKLVDRMQSFADQRPMPRDVLNIHAVLDHCKRLAQAGFARHIRFNEVYDPSLPHVFGNRDQLVQVFLNLLKNAAEAIGAESIDGEISLTTAYRPGMRLKSRGGVDPVGLPMEICIRDNGPGIPNEIVANLFDPFVTTKAQGSGLGLALVAKVIGDHGGIVECESLPRKTTFRVLMPVHAHRRRLEA